MKQILQLVKVCAYFGAYASALAQNGGTVNRQLKPTATLPKISPPPSPPSIPIDQQPRIPIPISSLSTPVKLVRRQSLSLPKISPPPSPPALPDGLKPKLPIPVATLGLPLVRRSAQGAAVFVTVSTVNSVVPISPTVDAGPTGVGVEGGIEPEGHAHGGMGM